MLSNWKIVFLQQYIKTIIVHKSRFNNSLLFRNLQQVICHSYIYLGCSSNVYQLEFTFDLGIWLLYGLLFVPWETMLRWLPTTSFFNMWWSSSKFDITTNVLLLVIIFKANDNDFIEIASKFIIIANTISIDQQSK